MKKIISLSLLALFLSANTFSIKAVNNNNNSILQNVANVILYPPKKLGSAIKHNFEGTKHHLKAIKERFVALIDITKGTIVFSMLIVACVTTVCGIDIALEWANKIGLPATFFNKYTFGTFYNSVHTYVAPIVATSPEFFASIPNKIKSISELIKYLPKSFSYYFGNIKVEKFWGSQLCIYMDNVN
ncbi:hypothetical protein ACFLYH_02345 [Candidatus Dependentiae bacterium]